MRPGSSQRRAAVVVIDACGAGALPDAADYGDEGTNTLAHVADAVGGLELPVLASLGLGNVTPILGVEPVGRPVVHGLLAPLAVVVGLVAALAALFARGIVPLALGALVGLGASAAALDGGVLVRQAHFSGSADRTGSAVLALGAAASVLLAVVAARAAAREREDADTPARVSGLAAAVGLATALVLAGLLVPFNGGGEAAGFSDPSAVLPDRWPDEAWAVFHPAVVLAGAWAAVAAAAGGHRRFAAGLLGALGAVGACVWWRYAVVPLDLDDRFGSFAPGGFLGLAGALLLVWAARRAGRSPAVRGVP